MSIAVVSAPVASCSALPIPTGQQAASQTVFARGSIPTVLTAYAALLKDVLVQQAVQHCVIECVIECVIDVL